MVHTTQKVNELSRQTSYIDILKHTYSTSRAIITELLQEWRQEPQQRAWEGFFHLKHSLFFRSFPPNWHSIPSQERMGRVEPWCRAKSIRATSDIERDS